MDAQEVGLVLSLLSDAFHRQEDPFAALTEDGKHAWGFFFETMSNVAIRSHKKNQAD